MITYSDFSIKLLDAIKEDHGSCFAMNAILPSKEYNNVIPAKVCYKEFLSCGWLPLSYVIGVINYYHGTVESTSKFEDRCGIRIINDGFQEFMIIE